MTATGKTLATIAFDPKRIEKRNAAFSRMPNHRKRMAIARDVLAQIEAKRYLAKTGSYVVSRGLNERVYGDVHSVRTDEHGRAIPQMSLQEALLEDAAAQCNVCALGSAFCSMARLEGGLTLRQVCGIHETLTPIFGQNQVALIEYAFEGCYSGSGLILTSAENEQCSRFHDKYDDDSKRLEAIFTNIVRNKGTFKIGRVKPPSTQGETEGGSEAPRT